MTALGALPFVVYKTVVFAQKQIVTGTVADNNNTPLPGVTIGVKGGKNFTTTGTNGNFSIVVDNPSAGTLIFSNVGFEKQEITISGARI